MTRRQHRDAFVIETPEGRRFDVALERFIAGNPFDFRDVAFRLDANGAVCCVIHSSWQPSNITAETAINDFAAAKRVLDELVSSSAQFASAVQGRPVSCELIDDYGTGSILICSLIADDIFWAPGFPQSETCEVIDCPTTAGRRHDLTELNSSLRTAGISKMIGTYSLSRPFFISAVNHGPYYRMHVISAENEEEEEHPLPFAPTRAPADGFAFGYLLGWALAAEA